MKRFNLHKILAPKETVPFWMPWGLGKWSLKSLLFVPLLLLFLLLFCLPPSPQRQQEPEPGPEPEPIIHTGEVQVLLKWETSDDLDLHVTDPSGERIYYSHKRSASGGELDVDANASNIVLHPKENVYWPEGGAPSGHYKVEVVLYALRTVPPISYEVKVKHGEQEDYYTGQIAIPRGKDHICEFDLE